jgi:hypothetical protein
MKKWYFEMYPDLASMHINAGNLLVSLSLPTHMDAKWVVFESKSDQSDRILLVLICFFVLLCCSLLVIGRHQYLTLAFSEHYVQRTYNDSIMRAPQDYFWFEDTFPLTGNIWILFSSPLFYGEPALS